ncbi:hypothetical protein [Halobaculum sp. D14]|uniref:hypothetical protein n=1 Tax=Halobaculum sp. D14 TaxID=3421642 RepID=UPI003EB82434
MVSTSKLLTVMLGVVIAVVLLGPFVTTINGNVGTQTVTNETVTADVGSYVDVTGYNVVSGSATVYGYNDTSGSFEVAAAGTDYELDEGAGSVKALNGSTLINDGETMKVSYDYQATSGTTTTVLNLLPLLVGVLILGTVGMKVQKEL